MFQLIIVHNNIEISNRTLSLLECRSIEGDGALWLINAFDKYMGLDINSYRISEYKVLEDRVIIYIRTEDLIELRDKKLNSIFEKK